MTRTIRNITIDLIKGASVLYIVGFWHLFNYTNAFPNYDNAITIRLTVIVLGLFMFVSGYLIGNKQFQTVRGSLAAYYRSRLLRIYPPYIVAILCFYLLGISDGQTLIKAATLVSMFAGPPPPTLWFITMIVFFYILSPALVRLKNNVLNFFMACLAIEIFFVLLDILDTPVDMRIAIYFPSFVAGVFFSRHSGVSGVGKTSMITAFFLASVALSFLFKNHPEQSYISIPLVLAGPLLIYTFIKQRELSIPWVRPLSWLSYASYFAYLFHRPAYEILRKLYFPDSFVMQAAYLFIFCLPLIFITSWSAQRIYDQLVRALSARYSWK